MSNIADLKDRLEVAEAERDYFSSLVDSFYSGVAPVNGNFNHIIMAQWGRKRLAEKSKSAVLLGGTGGT